jgi:DNA-directed RNA polymerase specialized sigma24 family protein
MNWQELPDQELVELCLQGDEDAWVELLRRYRRLIAGVAAKTILRSFRPTISLVQDLVQESIAKICVNDFRALRELEWRHAGALKGLLQVTASTTAQDYLRKWLSEKRDIRKEDSLEQEGLVIPAQESPAPKVEQSILLQQLARCLKKVTQDEEDSTRDIAIFLLFYGCKITAADLSRLYKLNLKKVENTLARLGRLARVHCL